MKPTQQLANRLKDNPHFLPASRIAPGGNAMASFHGPWHCTRLGRQDPMNGILVVNKPSGMTSAQVVAEVKAFLKVKKVGHTGTLDPFATGVLLCCINQATRLAQFLMCGKKVYEGVMHLGICTDTQDHTGQVISRTADLTVTNDQIRSVLHRFLGVREQIPPAFSALKHRGVPLYRLARRGDFVRKPSRQISVYELELLDMDLPHVRFRVSCTQGTYVRTLCADIGEALGCGAHLAQLCRTESGGFKLEEAIPLSTLKEEVMAGRASDHIIPMSQALRRVPEVKASPALAKRIRHGQPLTRAELGRLGDPSSPWIKVIDGESTLIAVLGAEERNGAYPYACVLPKGIP